MSRKAFWYLAVFVSFPFLVHFSSCSQKTVIKSNSSMLMRNKEHGAGFAAFKKHQDRYLNVSTTSVATVKSVKQCLLLAAMDSSVFSFNFAILPSVHGLHRCELLPTDLFNNTDKLTNNSAYFHYSIGTPCDGNPCQHGSSCLALYSSDDYKCICRRGFIGQNCQYDVDECVSNPCLHSGTCVNLVGSFSCNCAPFYVGATCDTKVCKSGWTEWHGFCYKVFTTLMNWNDAVSTCKTHGSNLTSVTSMEETNFLKSLVKSAISDTYVWIGLNDIAQEGVYEWVDGALFSFTNWGQHQPNDPRAEQNCADFAVANGVWYDFGCHNEERFVCKYLK